MRIPLLCLLAACSGSDDSDGDDVGTDTPDAPTPTGQTADTGTAGPPTDTGPRFAPPIEVCINEIMPGNVRAWDDGTSTWPDWIEIHNPGSVAIDLKGWSLTDDRDDWRKHVFTTSVVVAPGAFLILVADGLPELGDTHLSFSLDQQGEEVAIFRDDGSGEIIAYGEVVDDVAIARTTDCGPIDDWDHVFAGTPGASNE